MASIIHRRWASAARVGVPPMPKLFVFDMAGTTVDDMIDGRPLVTTAMTAAFAEARGIRLQDTDVDAVRGLEKRQAVRSLLASQLGSPPSDESVGVVHRCFEATLDRLLTSGVREMPGTSEVFRTLRVSGASVWVGSGFPEHVVDGIVNSLGWRYHGLVDGVLSAADGSRPDPAMIHKAMRESGVSSATDAVKVGDTVADIEEGKNAGSPTIAVLSGTQGRAKLEAAAPDWIVRSVADVPGLFSRA